ncbi:flotillin family protein [Leyella stercorea]|uniref:flotillin family protein n=1 Tax=Leyella stercorea TaxID=363265 RepID=UPI00266CE2A0|nr:flotillin family protein [Leyella stercorea]
MGTNLFILAGLLVVIVLLGIIGILSRYRKCKSDEVLVVYGKTGGSKSAKLYHGGAAFVWPIIQGYDFLSMKPMQIDCKLTGAISAQNIRVDVPTTITVAISTDPEVMQNAAERMLGLSMDDKQNLITDVVYGQMRLVIADMTIEELNSDRDKFLAKVKDNIDTELRKFGLYLMNINISDIRDAANYIVNLGKEAESKAQNEAQANIEEQEKLGAIKIANQIKERETRVAETRKDQEVAIAATRKEQEISVAQTDKERVSQVALANADKESQVARAEAEKNINVEQANTAKESRIAELNSDMEIKQAEAKKKAAIGRNEAQKEIALSNAQLSVTQANADKEAGEAAARSEAAVQTARERAQKEVEEAKALKVESSLKAEKIVPAEVAKQEAILQADAVAEKVIREAEAKAKATLAQAEAEAKAIRMRLEAEAEGKKMSLLAEADGFQAMVKAAELNPAIAIQYKMVDQWKEIAGEQVKAFEKMQLGNVTVFDGGDGATGNFLNSFVKTVAPSLGVLDQLPIGETVKKILHPEKKDEGTEKEGTEKKDEK